MPRLASLLIVAVLAVVAGATGVAAGGRAAPATRAERAASDARRIGPGAKVKVSMPDGTSVRGVLVLVGDHEIAVLVTDGPQKGERRIAYDQVERIKKEGSRTGLWIALGITVGLLVPIGICAAAA